MKSSVAVLFAVWCVTWCAAAPGAPAADNFELGKWIFNFPDDSIRFSKTNLKSTLVAPVFESWRNVFKRVLKHVDAEDHLLIQHLADSVDGIEKAVIAKDLQGIVKVYEGILPDAKRLLPHFKQARLREVFDLSIHHVEDLVKQLKAPDAHIDHVNAFLRKIVAQSSILLKEILIEVQENAAKP